MKREDIIRNIKFYENKIISKLDLLGLKSTYKVLSNGEKVKSNKMMGVISNELNKSFYDYNTKRIKEKVGILDTNSLYTSMNMVHLTYRLEAMKSIYFTLDEVETTSFSELKEHIIMIAVRTGKNYRKVFKENEGNIPFTSLQKTNPVNILKATIEDKIDNFDQSKSYEKLVDELKMLSRKLNDELPKHFNKKEAYGSSIGKLMESIYGVNTNEMLTILKSFNCKPGTNIISSMDRNHLIYRHVSLSILYKYYSMFNANEFDLYLEKCKMVGHITREIFTKNLKESPYKNLIKINKEKQTKIENIKISKNVSNAKYKMKPNNDILMAEEYEQMSMFSNQREYRQ